MNDRNEFERDLERYLAGEMSEREATVFEACLDDALAAQESTEEIAVLKKQTEALPRQFAPPAAVWEEISRSIRHIPASRRGWQRRNFGMLAAAAVILICAGLYLRLPDLKERNGETSGEQASTQTWVKECEAAEKAYAAARRQLLMELEARPSGLSPETREVLEKNLSVIDDAVREIRAAMDEDPANPRLMQLLLATREKEVRLLDRLARMPEAS